MNPATVYIIDDDEMARGSLSFLLSTHGIPTQIFGSGAEFFEEARSPRGCILLDLRMPDMDGLAFQQELKDRGYVLPIVMISAEGDFPSAVRAIKRGALDFLDKGGCETELVNTVRGALDEFRALEDGLRATEFAAARMARLSPREREVLEGVIDGLQNKEIARHLGLSPRTVEMHRAKMAAKLGVSQVADIVRLALEVGMGPAEVASHSTRTGS